MINNEQDYQNTKEWIAQFEQNLATPLPENDPIDPRVRQIERDAYASMIGTLRREMAEYETRHPKRDPAREEVLTG